MQTEDYIEAQREIVATLERLATRFDKETIADALSDLILHPEKAYAWKEIHGL